MINYDSQFKINKKNRDFKLKFFFFEDYVKIKKIYFLNCFKKRKSQMKTVTMKR